MEDTEQYTSIHKGKTMASSSAQAERTITFQSAGQPSFLLEGILHVPTIEKPAPIVVLCHPQPASSDMNDSLTVVLAQRLAADTGMFALRFNFRGVGKSQGQQTDGRMEPLDLAGAINATIGIPGVNRDKVAVIGHGFGANIALMYAPYDYDQRIRTVVAISLLLYRIGNGFPKAFERPKLFITGEFDEICPRHKLEPFVEQQPGPKGMNVITGARHLMRGYEDETANAVIKYIKKWAVMPGV
jgi:alpha/beta superfamily hydrolase